MDPKLIPPSRCGWCNGYLSLSSADSDCPHPDALEGAPPRPRTPPVILDAVPGSLKAGRSAPVEQVTLSQQGRPDRGRHRRKQHWE